MRIALICTELLPVPPIRGGAVQILINGVVPYLSRNHKITVFGIADEELPDKEEVDGVKYIRVPRKDYPNEVARILERKHEKKQAYDLIHVFNRPLNLLKYKKASPDSRFVVSLHNEMFSDKKIPHDKGEDVVKSVNRIMTISDYIGSTITRRFPKAKEKMQTVYSGIDLEQYKPIWSEEAQQRRHELREQYGVKDKKVILFVGRLSSVKGPHILLKAMEKVVREHPNAVLVILGSKWFTDHSIDNYGRQLQELAKTIGESRVVFTGFIPPKDIPAYFTLGDIFVCSSQWQEPLARVHYEAMGAGLPIITTGRGGNPEIITHQQNGLVIWDYKNPDVFADKINYLLNNRGARRRLSRAGRAFVENDYGFEHVASRLEGLYAKAMEDQ